MKLEKFNLSRALSGDPIITRDGRKVIEIHYLHSNIPFPVIAVIQGERLSQGCDEEGLYEKGIERDCDLFMAPKTKKIWTNLYYNKNADAIHSGNFYTEEEIATSSKIPDEDYKSYISTIEVEIPC